MEYLKNFIESDEHKYGDKHGCVAWDEGQYCCLEKEEFEFFLRKLIFDIIQDAKRFSVDSKLMEKVLKDKYLDK